MANSGLTQRQIQPNNNYHCKDCGVFFDSIKSLDVHLRYHKENLLSKWATQSNYSHEESNNNTNHKNGNNAKQRNEFNSTIAAAADSSDSMMKTGPPTSQSRPTPTPYNRGSPPIGMAYSHPTTMANYNVGSPYQNHDPQRFSPANGHPMFPYPNGMPNKTPPPPNNAPYQTYPQPHANYLSVMRSPSAELNVGGCGYFDGNNMHQNYPGNTEQFSNNSTTLRSTTPSSVSSPSSSSSGPLSTSAYRYHPYQQQHTSPYGGDRAVVSSSSFSARPSSPQQCEKCGAICDTSAALSEHLTVAHPPTPVGQQYQPPASQRNNGFSVKQELFAEFNTEVQIKTEDDEETPAEILDLDSHKVHVYQPPEEEEAALRANGNPHSVSAMLWGNSQLSSDKSYRNINSPPERKVFHPLGRNPTPDFGVTSTLTSPQPELVPQSYQQQQQRYRQVPDLTQPGIQPQQPITSTQVPNNPPSLPNQPNSPQIPTQPTGKGNASWKSNEARRPKTYNCSACNKWFTSSGHLKRHYNTTLHKNAVKQSGQPDPASLPINAHHHPDRDPNYVPRGSRGGSSADHSVDSAVSPVPSLGNEDSSRSDDYGRMTPQHMQMMAPVNGGVMQNGGNLVNHQMMASPPNRLAGPSEYEQSGGLHSLVSSPQATYIQENHLMESSVHRQSIMGGSPPPQHIPSPPQLTRRPSSPSHQLLQQPHMLHHPHPVALLTNAQMEQQMMQTYPNAQPPHVTTSQTPQITNTTNINQITSIGNSPNGIIGSSLLSDNAILEELQPMQHYFGNGNMFPLPVQQPLPSFAQFNHQNYAGQTLTMLHGFNGAMTSPSYMVSTDNVGGLLPSPSNHHHQTLLMESFQQHSESSNNNNNNIYITDDIQNVISLNGDIRHKNLMNNNSDSNTSLGEDVMSPVGTPDCPTSTNSDFESVDTKKVTKVDDSVTVSSTNDTINFYSSVSISNGTIHKCIDCDKVFNKACYLTQHNKSFHSGAKPFKCNRCGKRFPAEYLYEEHLLKHAPDKPYKCEICPKQFNHKTDLRRHLCLHTGEKPYACEICGKGFIRKDHMLKHCITHRRKYKVDAQQPQHQQQHPQQVQQQHIIAQ